MNPLGLPPQATAFNVCPQSEDTKTPAGWAAKWSCDYFSEIELEKKKEHHRKDNHRVLKPSKFPMGHKETQDQLLQSMNVVSLL